MLCYVMLCYVMLCTLSLSSIMFFFNFIYRLRLREDKSSLGKGLTLLSPMMKSTRINQKLTVLLFVIHPSLAHCGLVYLDNQISINSSLLLFMK